MPVEYYPDGEIFEEEYEDEEMNDLVKSLYSSKSRDSVSDMVQEFDNSMKISEEKIQKSLDSGKVKNWLDNEEKEFFSKSLYSVSDMVQEFDNSMKIREEKNQKSFDSEKVRNLLENGKKEVFDIITHCDQFIEFPKNYLLITNFTRGLYLYDQNFLFIKLVKKIDNKRINSFDIESNKNKNILYIYNRITHEIIMANTEFQMIKSVGGMEDFGFVKGLCFHNVSLYVSDYDTCCIKVYSEELELLNSIVIGYRPLRLKANNKMLGVETFRDNEFSFVFYSLDSINNKKKTETTYLFKFTCVSDYQRISEIDSVFYEINPNSKCVFYFKEGKLLEKVLLSEITFFNSYWNYIRFGNSIITIFKKKLLKISLN